MRDRPVDIRNGSVDIRDRPVDIRDGSVDIRDRSVALEKAPSEVLEGPGLSRLIAFEKGTGFERIMKLIWLDEVWMKIWKQLSDALFKTNKKERFRHHSFFYSSTAGLLYSSSTTICFLASAIMASAW